VTFHRVGETVIHGWALWKLIEGEIESPDGERFERTFVHSPGAVGVVPLQLDEEGNPSVVLVRQYRAAFDAPILELPAGMLDVDGEAPIETARRELAEEAGFACRYIEPLTTFLPSPGLTDATLQLFVATDLEPVPLEPHGPEERHIEIIHLPLDEAVAMVERGEIADAKTVIGLLLIARRTG
jgi:8-oxo-dGTP pyrophosphatase MutT (NUDIX family)